MREADRKLASAVVVAAWAVAGSAIAAAALSPTKAVATSPSAVNFSAAQGVGFDAIQVTADALARESRCLAQAIYYEARSESSAGQIAVAEVVVNRVLSESYPNSICEVVFQGAERVEGCQFSFTCDGSLGGRVDAVAWGKAKRMARNIVMGYRHNLVGTATHYHADYVAPYWAGAFEKTTQIGRHIFYSDPKGADRG